MKIYEEEKEKIKPKPHKQMKKKERKELYEELSKVKIGDCK